MMDDGPWKIGDEIGESDALRPAYVFSHLSYLSLSLSLSATVALVLYRSRNSTLLIFGNSDRPLDNQPPHEQGKPNPHERV